MSPFYKTLRIYSIDRARSVAIEALVDTGSSYSIVPAPLLAEIGVRPQREQSFILGDEREMVRPVAQVAVEVDGHETYTWCIFGESGSGAIIGAHTLEGAGLMVDPINHRLVPLVGRA